MGQLSRWPAGARQIREARPILRDVGLDIDVTSPVGGAFDRRLQIEIGEAIGQRARILITDEPTAR